LHQLVEQFKISQQSASSPAATVIGGTQKMMAAHA
jgi:hypothetical protein